MNSIDLKIKKEIAILDFNQPDSKVNVLTAETMKELSVAINKVAENSKIKALLLTSSKPDIFIAGADIKEIEHITSKEEAREKAEKGKDILNRLCNLDLITVAVINGACLGGGLELALSCSYRVASFSNKVKIGLPEVKLGIIPGFGGTQRLPRLIGFIRGLSMILAGKIISAKEALKCGLVDRLFPDLRLVDEAIEFANKLIEKKIEIKKKRKKKLFQTFLEQTPLGRAIVCWQAKKSLFKRTKGFYPAPLKALDLIKRTYAGGRAKGYRLESEVFSELAVSQISKNLIKVFYLDEEFKKYNWVSKELEPAKVKKCAIIGAGVMGGGIAQLLTFNGFPTRLKDIAFGALGTALKTAYGLFAYACKKRLMKKQKAEFAFGLISPTLSYQGVENADIVIEAVVENAEVKQKVFSELEGILSDQAIIASNTSSLPIGELSRSLQKPERVVGLHFFNPVHRMPLVEVIRSNKTNDKTIATVIAFARKLRKIVIVVGDTPGFLVNRILLPYLNEAGFLLEEGMRIEHIDKIACDFGMPMGPLELIDEVGIDVGYKVVKILEGYYGSRMKTASMLEEVKKKGLSGKRTKKGFYIHKGKKKVPNQEIYSLVVSTKPKLVSEEIALKRMIYIMINEAACCLGEKVVDRPETVDVGMIMGTGFPPFRAGLLHYADSIGLDKIVEDLADLEKEFKAERFKPCDHLRKLADENSRFYL